MKQTIFYKIIIGIVAVVLLTACQKKGEALLYGSWRLQTTNYICTINNNAFNVNEDGDYEQKMALYNHFQSQKPLAYSFTDKGLLMFWNGGFFSTPIKIIGNKITVEKETNILGTVLKEQSTIIYEILGDELKLTIESVLPDYISNQMPENAKIENVKQIIVFKKGSIEGEDEYLAPPVEIVEGNGEVYEKTLTEMIYEPYMHPTSTDYPENFYENHKDHSITIIETNDRKICIGYRGDNLWLLAYSNEPDWRIVQIYNSNQYLNTEYIFFTTNKMRSISEITEKREFGSGSGYTPLSFALEDKYGYVVGHKVGNDIKFVRIWVKNRDTNSITLQYQFF